MSGGVRRATPVVPNRAVREMLIHLARVHFTAFTHELQQELCSLPARSRPRKSALGGNTGIRARMHQCLYGGGHETIVEEEILFNTELGIETFEVAGTVVLDSMAQHQVLRARGRANRVGLHKAQPVEGAFQRGRRKDAVGGGKASQVVERDRHNQMLRKVSRVINYVFEMTR